jgi:hypothetical protein
MKYLLSRVARTLLVLSMAALGACSKPADWRGSLEDMLLSQPDRFGLVMQDPEQHRLQIIYTQVDRDEKNVPSFTSFTYRVDATEYFYPASTVKLPTALLALEKLNTMENVDRDTPMLTGTSAESHSSAIEDISSPGGLPSIGHYIRKILLVSDNDAYNRLYEFLGQELLNDSMRAKGYTDTRIMHRLEVVLSIEENKLTNPVTFQADGDVIYEQGPQYSSRSYAGDKPIMLGQAEIVGDELLQRPKNFAEKNAFSLQDFHDVIKALMFPDAVDERERFDLTDDDYRFLYGNMIAYPGNSGIAAYSDANEYPDSFVKFLMIGGSAGRIPGNLHILNKVGDAYGFLTDAAYIVDLDNDLEFILAATIYTNANETFNDNNYEYAETGLPFLRDLGQAIYEVELNRVRTNAPDLSRFFSSE